MKFKKYALLILPIMTIILELLPYGAALNFANPDGEPHIQTYSYFSLTPYGYANFGPFLTAILTCGLLILTLVSVFKFSKGLNMAIKLVSLAAIVTSLLPLMLGFEYFTFTAVVISVLLVLEFGVSFIKDR